MRKKAMIKKKTKSVLSTIMEEPHVNFLVEEAFERAKPGNYAEIAAYLRKEKIGISREGFAFNDPDLDHKYLWAKLKREFMLKKSSSI